MHSQCKFKNELSIPSWKKKKIRGLVDVIIQKQDIVFTVETSVVISFLWHFLEFLIVLALW